VVHSQGDGARCDVLLLLLGGNLPRELEMLGCEVDGGSGGGALGVAPAAQQGADAADREDQPQTGALALAGLATLRASGLCTLAVRLRSRHRLF